MTRTALSGSAQSLLKRSFPSLQNDPLASPSQVSTTAFPDAQYTDAEKAEIDQWAAEASQISADRTDGGKSLTALNTHLASRTTVLGSKPSVADIALFSKLGPAVQKWTSEERTGEHGFHHIVRHLDFVQNAPVFGLKLEEGEKVAIDTADVKYVLKPVDMKAEKERKKREKEAAAAAAGSAAGSAVQAEDGKKGKKDKLKDKIKEKVEQVAETVGAATSGGALPVEGGKKKEKKEKQPKPQKAAPVEKPLSPAHIDLRVGHILKAEQHPNADSLYVSTIAVGDPPGADNTTEYEGQVVRTVCSGLNGLIPLEEMQNRKIITVCNLKPVTMRGIKSCAMVLAASPRVVEGGDSHAGPVELVSPPTGSTAGERVYFEGWEGEPEAVLNPKKKIWETLQPGFTTTDGLEVGFEMSAVPQLAESGGPSLAKLRTKEGLCSVPTLKGATVR